VQKVEFLPNKCKALSSNPSTTHTNKNKKEKKIGLSFRVLILNDIQGFGCQLMALLGGGGTFRR
jgi:hypothetical protein